MRLVTRLTGGGKKDFHSTTGFSEPLFWSQDPPWGSYVGSSPEREPIGNDFQGYIHGAYKSSGVVFACMLARESLFSEARFIWRARKNGRGDRMFGDTSLSLLERPWPGGTTGELLVRMIQDADLAGNFYATTADDRGNIGRRSAGGPNRRIRRMRPDWVTIIMGSNSGDPRALDAKIIGYEYKPPPNGFGFPETEPVLLLPSEVVHYSPHPDPAAEFRGMSWLTPVLREVAGDKAAMDHKLKFFEQGASIQTVVSLDKEVTPEQYQEFVEKFKKQTEGVNMAYKTLFLGGGADVTLNGATLQQLDFKATQGAGETRIAAAAGMHPVIVGLSEGLAGSSLNAGNFQAAIRLTADKTIRPLWRNAASALSRILPGMGDNVELWYDDREVAFLRDDTTDVAAIQNQQATTIRTLTDAGYTPESAAKFVETNNLQVLEHSGLYSVQLRPPGTMEQTGTIEPANSDMPMASPEEA